jgi:hypothetical protein
LLTKTFESDDRTPHLILGHTHVPRWNALVSKWSLQVFHKYTNSATAGRYDGLIWCVEIVNGNVSLHAWYKEECELANHVMNDSFPGRLKPARVMG